MSKEKQGTLVSGIGASEHLDSSGEVLRISGLDISSLEKGDGVLNYEHKNDQPSQIVGKIIFAKKIYSEVDCTTENELHFWKKSQLPFLYIVGELFDAVGHGQAKEIAAMLKYDHQKRSEGPNYKNVIGFSVEGGKLSKKNNEIDRSIARKISCTVMPCNKMALAEQLVPQQKSTKTNTLDIDSILKTETSLPIEILSKTEAPFSNPAVKGIGPAIGKTTSGKPIHMLAMPRQYSGFSSKDHADAMNLHHKLAQSAPDFKQAQSHLNTAKMHMQARDAAENKEGRFAQGKQQVVGRALASVKKSQDVAPSALTGYAALQRECISKKIKKQAEDAFSNLKNKQTLVKAVMDRNPNLFKHQAEALVKIAAYKDMKKSERKLAKLHKKISK